MDRFTLEAHHALVAELIQAAVEAAAEIFAGSDLQTGFREILGDPIVVAWFEAADLQPLLIDYLRLESLGRLYIEHIERAGSNAGLSSRASIYDPNSGLGYGRILENGKLAWHSYAVEWYPNPGNDIPENRGTFASDIRAVTFADDAMDIRYPGIEHLGGPNWAAVVIRVGGVYPSATRASRDYSRFAALRMETGLCTHVARAKLAGASREEVVSAIMVGVPVAGAMVLRMVPAAIGAYDEAYRRGQE